MVSLPAKIRWLFASHKLTTIWNDKLLRKRKRAVPEIRGSPLVWM